MMLRQYLDKERMPVSEMARRLGIHRNHMFMLLNGQRRPSIELARHIEDLTKKEVTLDDLIPPKPKCQFCPACGQKICES